MCPLLHVEPPMGHKGGLDCRCDSDVDVSFDFWRFILLYYEWFLVYLGYVYGMYTIMISCRPMKTKQWGLESRVNTRFFCAVRVVL